MKLKLIRYSSGLESTLGLLFVDDEFSCYTLEDQANARKIMHETRIPAGSYKITLRTEGGFHANYLKKFKNIHKGMLWIRNVPGFEYILIHVGNTDLDSSGCILVGDSATQNITGRGSIASSVNAYIRFYPIVAAALISGEDVTIEIVDLA